mgnify:CR=1 FL=1|jgi:pterin-4a-carbinolamine dehydratase|tara:strand:- start:2707 stop:3117 length:411 start_codon:yes stop_codon:yes gene_type:complete
MKLIDLISESERITHTGYRSADILFESLRSESTLGLDELPVSVDRDDWSHLKNPERISKSFKFLNFEKLSFFLGELLNYQEESQHHAKIIIENNTVNIESYTHVINSVTSLDFELAKFCDNLYEDIQFIGNRDKVE